MPYLPAFLAPTRHTDPATALAQVRQIYDTSIAHLREAMHAFVAGDIAAGSAQEGTHSTLRKTRACYPFVRLHTDTVSRTALASADGALKSFGFVAGPGRYETTLTRPDLFGQYYFEQFRLLLQNHGVALEVGTSSQPIPVHFSFAEHDHIEGSMTAQRRTLMRDVFDLPNLAAMDDGIANGTYQARPGEPQPL